MPFSDQNSANHTNSLQSKIPPEIIIGKGGLYIKFYSPEIIMVDCEGELADCIIDKLNSYLFEYHYQSLVRNYEHHTFIILDISLLTSVKNKLLEKIPFLLAIIHSPKSKGKISFTKKYVQITQSIDEALLYVLAFKQQRQLISKNDYYTNFIQRWLKEPGLNHISNYRVLSDPSWQISGEKLKMYATIDVIEGNILKLTLSGFIDNFSVERLIHLIKKVLYDIGINQNHHSIVLIIDSKGVVGFSLRIYNFMGSMIKREINTSGVYLVPSGIVKTYHYLFQFSQNQVYTNWELITDVDTAIDKSIVNQLSIDKGLLSQNKINSLIQEKKKQPLFLELFESLKPLTMAGDEPPKFELIQNPSTLGDYVKNLVINLWFNNQQVEHDAPEIPSVPVSLLNTLNQAVLICQESRIISANRYSEKVWGYDPFLLNNQPLAVLVDLSSVSEIIKMDSNQTMEGLITYHYNGYSLPMNCTKIKVGDGTYYLSFTNQ